MTYAEGMMNLGIFVGLLLLIAALAMPLLGS